MAMAAGKGPNGSASAPSTPPKRPSSANVRNPATRLSSSLSRSCQPRSRPMTAPSASAADKLMTECCAGKSSIFSKGLIWAPPGSQTTSAREEAGGRAAVLYPACCASSYVKVRYRGLHHVQLGPIDAILSAKQGAQRLSVESRLGQPEPVTRCEVGGQRHPSAMQGDLVMLVGVERADRGLSRSSHGLCVLSREPEQHGHIRRRHFAPGRPPVLPLPRLGHHLLCRHPLEHGYQFSSKSITSIHAAQSPERQG